MSKSPHMFRWILVALLFSCSIAAQAQFNVKIGYNLGFVSPEINNGILESFNVDQTGKYDQYTKMNELKLMYGVSLGLRQKFEFGALTFDWENISRSVSSVGIQKPPLPAQPISFSQELTYTFNMLMIGLETSYGMWGIGSSVGRNFVSITQKTQSGDSFSLFNETDRRNQYFARFNFSLNFYGNSTVAFAIKPYVHIPLSKINLASIASALELSGQTSEESFPMWGLSFCFYNGRQ